MRSASYHFKGETGDIHVTTWVGDDAPRFITLLAHGYGEHAGRYEHVAEMLVGLGAVVYAPDHVGHGRSAGERALVEDIETLVTDLHAVADRARAERPGLPLVLVGHSMGGLIATRFAQRYLDELTALVLSGPLVGDNPGVALLLEMDPIPDIPIDPAILSRDPAVGAAYAADPLVYHGPFLKTTLQALVNSVDVVAAGGTFGDVPTLWIHGTADQLVPYEPTAASIEHIRGTSLQHTAYEGAAHEVFNETNNDEVLGEVADFLRKVLSLD
jgi:alpha-beta hydrolase superfamily lysophospholipase